MGDRGIMLMGGTLSLHGDREHTWTKLARTAEAGSTRSKSSMPVAGAEATRSSSPRPTSIPGRRRGAPSPPSAGTLITLDRALQYMHFGKDHLSASTSVAKSAC
jgi:cell migration-inducing and hyaluronan-binding protein